MLFNSTQYGLMINILRSLVIEEYGEHYWKMIWCVSVFVCVCVWVCGCVSVCVCVCGWVGGWVGVRACVRA